jgi:alpha-soluble NSF attachment protein
MFWFYQADKALQAASGGFSLFGGRTERYENAADLYIQAANAFRVQKLSMSWSFVVQAHTQN